MANVRLLVPCALLALWCAGFPAAHRAEARTFAVNSNRDEGDARPGDGACRTSRGRCTVRAAVQEANAWPGADVVVLGSGLYRLAIPPEESRDDATGDLDIRGDLAITGAGRTETVLDGDFLDRVFEVHGWRGKVSISHMTIRGGEAEFGGGIKNWSRATLSLRDCRVVNNHSTSGGGGGVALDNGVLVVERCLIEGNHATGELAYGGGIGVGSAGRLLVRGSTVSDNVVHAVRDAAAGGGGIATLSSCLPHCTRIERSLIADNQVWGYTRAEGGGIYGPSLAVVGSDIRGNLAHAEQGVGQGGGIHAQGGRLSVSSSSLTGNTASGAEAVGGGLFVDGVQGAELADLVVRTNKALSSGNARGGGLAFEYLFARGQYEAKRLSVAGNLVKAGGRGEGGGVRLADEAASLSLKESVVNWNAVFGAEARGGGISHAGPLVVSGGAVVGNSAIGTTEGLGGGIRSMSALTLVNAARITDNFASHQGGGVSLAADTVPYSIAPHCRVVRNAPSDIHIDPDALR